MPYWNCGLESDVENPGALEARTSSPSVSHTAVSLPGPTPSLKQNEVPAL